MSRVAARARIGKTLVTNIHGRFAAVSMMRNGAA
jgi:hypothetical protein